MNSVLKLPFGFFSFLRNATAPKSHDEDTARREFILNVLLLSLLALFGTGVLIDGIHRIFSDPLAHEAESLPELALYLIFIFFAGLYALSRNRMVRLPSYLLVGAFLLLTAYMGYRWGVDVPAQIVFYPLVIVMAGILLSTRTAFLTTVLIAIVMCATAYAQQQGIVAVDTYWRGDTWRWGDVIMTVIIYAIVATVAWLSNREIGKSLARARRSEAALKEERDLLEVRVEERTRELRQAELERMSQAYRFVEFGRLASGIFHDLMNPLAALSLNIDRIADAPQARTTLSEDARRAKRAAAHMQSLLGSMKKHLVREGAQELFSVRTVLEEVTGILASYARERTVKLRLSAPEDLHLYGDPVSFTQALTNLISNAIQSYRLAPEAASDSSSRTARDVTVTLSREAGHAVICVRDYGKGIAEDDVSRIFDPFFTTKEREEGLGLGLSLAKRIAEKDFHGTITVDTALGEGSAFTLYLPIREP